MESSAEFSRFSLFEGNAHVELPSDAVNLRVPRGRPIPEHQEVFASSKSDDSLMIDLCEMVEGTPETALREHVEDIVVSPVPGVTWELKEMDVSGVLGVSSFLRSPEVAFVRCASVRVEDKDNMCVCVIRLPSYALDVVITANKGWDEGVFAHAVSTFGIDNFDFIQN